MVEKKGVTGRWSLVGRREREGRKGRPAWKQFRSLGPGFGAFSLGPDSSMQEACGSPDHVLIKFILRASSPMGTILYLGSLHAVCISCWTRRAIGKQYSLSLLLDSAGEETTYK
jgi:hypothetical protein